MANGEDPDDYGGAFMHPQQEDRDGEVPIVAKMTFFTQLFNIFNFAKRKRATKKVKDKKKFHTPPKEERLVMRDHEVRLRCLLTAAQSSTFVSNPVGISDDEWFDDDVDFDLFDYSIEEADDGLAKGLAIIMSGLFSHRPIRSGRRYAAYYGVRRNAEKWNPRFYGFDY
ncbi:hypothetical protein QR680_006155 [Steinernema hermaphroditum]|uniref:Uncharacterized protein n=1 Tax=Steinernema hermaphroditum TaxID=289476 RepID=A0AA39LWX7_9BILA|nr:hypothetical protein QR680_006155 [Steinernema hermaphroditum]